MSALPTAVETQKGLERSNLVAGSRPRPIIPVDIDQIWRLATIIGKSGLAPKDFETPERICIAIMHGMEIGLPPMMALQRIAVINGRPAVWGDAVPGIALSTGLVEDWFETVQGQGDTMVATCRVKRKGIKSPAERTFSVSDAKRAGLWDTRERVTRKKKDGTSYETRNDSPWFRYPKRMLQMRARVAFRDLFSDALGGLHIAEELITGPESEYERQMRDVTPPKTAISAAVPTPEEAPIENETEVGDCDNGAAENEGIENTRRASSKPLPPLVRQRDAEPPIVDMNDDKAVKTDLLTEELLSDVNERGVPRFLERDIRR